MNNYILEYYQAITDGTIVVGQWIIRWYAFIIHGIESGAFRYEPKKANKAIKFIEAFCRHHEGVLAPQLIKLELWQKALISVLFGIIDKDGFRQFREAFIVVGRKNGKTLLAAAISAYMAFLDGEYGGRIYYAAPKLEQAALCFDATFQMISKEPILAKRAKKRRTDVYIEESNTTIRPLAFNHKKSDGLNISLGICDEISSWQGDAGLKFYEVLKSSMGARKQPLLISISTAGYINDGTYDELFRRSTAFLMGASKETRLAPFLYLIDDAEKWNDINELRKSNPNLGVSISVDYMLEEIRIAEGSLSKLVEFKTKYCNIKQNSSTAWLDYKVVDACSGEELSLEDFRRSYAVIGIDLSQTTDLTAVTLVIERNEQFYVFAKFFMPSGRIEAAQADDGVPYEIFRKQGFLDLSGDNYVDYNDCYNWIISVMRQYQIIPLVIGYDRYSAQYLVEQLKAAGLKCDDVYQGNNLSPVIREFEGIIKDGKIHIGNNNLLKSHLLNVALKQELDTQKVRIVKTSQMARSDGVAALLDAMTVRMKWWNDIGEQLRNKR